MKITIFGLSITSSWGNGHATTYRGLIQELFKQGHEIVFLEKDVEWYAANRDLANPLFCKTILYRNLEELATYQPLVENAEVVMVGSYVPDGVKIGEWVIDRARGLKIFYDIDTPVTLAKLEREDYEYVNPELITRYDLYLSFTGGPTLNKLEQHYHSPKARALYCSVDPELYYPEPLEKRFNLAYMGTYSDDRQSALERLLLEPAKLWGKGKFAVVGPQYPQINWGENVERIEHLPPSQHRWFYNSQSFTLNITRADMIKAGYSPSVRLFEAAACGVPIISDNWKGLEHIFEIGTEILVAKSPQEVLQYLQEMPEGERQKISDRARAKVLREHTAAVRAKQLEQYIRETA